MCTVDVVAIPTSFSIDKICLGEVVFVSDNARSNENKGKVFYPFSEVPPRSVKHLSNLCNYLSGLDLVMAQRLQFIVGYCESIHYPLVN